MTDRTVRVSLTAQVSGYIAGMNQAAVKTREVGSAAERLAQKGAAMQTVGVALLAIGAAAAAGVGLAIKSFADFDAKMSQVKTLAHATSEEMDILGEAAKTMGQKIGFSALQTAEAEIELVKAGLDVSTIMSGALKGSLDLAAAGQIDVADATAIATIALTQFNLTGADVPHVADLLAAGADKALGGVSELGEALKAGGLVASQFGLSLDDTIGTLASFANAGLLGESAGTTLRQMLLKLGSPSAEAAATMKELGISLYDASGKFVGITNLSGQLQSKLSGLSEAQRNSAMATIFGSRAIAGANVLYKEGAKGIGQWIDDVNDSGFAATQAAGKMDNLKGDIAKLEAAFQSGLIEAGSTGDGVMRGLVQTLTNLTALFTGLPAPIQGGVLAVGAIIAVVATLAGTALLLVPRLAAMKFAMVELELSMKKVALSGGAVAVAVAVVVAAFSFFAAQTADAKARVDALTGTLDTNTGAITSNTRAVVAKALQDKGAFDAAKKLGISQKELTDAALGNEAALKKVSSAAKEYQAANLLGDSAARMFGQSIIDKALGPLGEQQAALKGSAEEFKNLKAATDKGTDSTESAADAYKLAADKAKGLSDQVANLTDQINTANGVGQDAVSQNANYQKALADATAQVKEYLKTHKRSTEALNENTPAGSANAAMLAGLAKDAQSAAKAQLELDGNTEAYQNRLADGRQAVIDRALALGATADQAQLLADKVAAIPTQAEIKILLDASNATRVLDKFIADLTARKPVLSIDGNIVLRPGQIAAHADGGTVGGSGGARADDRLIAASSGEEIIRNPFASMFRTQLKQMNRGQIPAFADGGTVGFSPAPTYSSAPKAATSSGGGGPMRISGKLDLGNGLTGFVDGVLTNAVNRAVPALMGGK